MTIGQRLRRAIERSGLTQKQVADRAGIDEKTLSKILNDLQQPSFDTVERIVRAVGVSWGVLFDEPRLLLAGDDADVARKFQGLLGRVLANSEAQQEAQRDRRVVSPPRHHKRESIGDAPPSGTWSEVESLPDEIIPEPYLRLGARRAFRVVTDAMVDAGLLEGSVIYVRPTNHLDGADGKIIVCRLNRVLYLKRADLRGHQLTLRSEKRNYDPIVRRESDEFTMIGVVVMLTSEGR